MNTNNIERIKALRNVIDYLAEIEYSDFLFNSIVILISNLQNKDGSFDLIKSTVPNDIKVYYNDETTYICTAILLRSFTKNEKWFLKNIGKETLRKALKVCSKRKFAGHGYEKMDVELKIIKMFLKRGLKKMIYKYPHFEQNFTNMINSIIYKYRERIKEENYSFGFGNYEKEIKEVIRLYDESVGLWYINDGDDESSLFEEI